MPKRTNAADYNYWIFINIFINFITRTKTWAWIKAAIMQIACLLISQIYSQLLIRHKLNYEIFGDRYKYYHSVLIHSFVKLQSQIVNLITYDSANTYKIILIPESPKLFPEKSNYLIILFLLILSQNYPKPYYVI